MHPLFDVLRERHLTTLKIRCDWRTGTDRVLGSTEWSPEQLFADYGRTFTIESELTNAPKALSDAHTRGLLDAGGCSALLVYLLGLMRKGRHQGVDIWRHPARPIVVISNMHSNVLGIGNRAHAIRAGGIRRHNVSEPLEEVLVDGLNLARGMSFKNAAAQIAFGGSKICVVSDPIDPDDDEAMGFLAWCIDRSRSFTGPDMGFEPRHADVLRDRFTRNIVGGSKGALGPTGGPTAHGLFVALCEAVSHHLSRENLSGLRVALQGLGAVGAPFGRALLNADIAELRIAEHDAGRIDAFFHNLPAEARERTSVVDPEQILFQGVDIVSPNAIGGVLDQTVIDRLRCRIVMGAANNQLAASSQQDELALSDRLAARGILFQVGWMHNAAGVIAGREEWQHQESAQMDRVILHLERVCRDGVRANLEEARANGCTPTAMAYKRIERQIYPE